MSDSPSFRVRLLDETTSTNDEIKHALAAGETEGIVVRARRQTGGYGRQGRSWTSPEGGLYASLLLHPEVNSAVLPTLSLVTSVAVRKALVRFLPEHERNCVLIKWPNDIVYRPSADKSGQTFGGPSSAASDQMDQDAADLELPSAPAFHKLCGISLESHAGGVCLGMGVNVFAPGVSKSVGGKNVPVYLAELAESADATEHLGPAESRSSVWQSTDELIDEVFASIMKEFVPVYERWQKEGFAPFAECYREHAALSDRLVRVMDRAGVVVTEGQAEGVDDDGRLVLRSADGSLSFTQSGEVHLA